MKNRLLLIALLLGSGAVADLMACGDKFLVASRGTRYQRAAVARQPANILVYTTPSSALPKALERVAVDATLRKAGYRLTSISAADDLDRALRQGGWDLVVADLADSATLRARLQGGGAPSVLPVAYNASGTELSQARRTYHRVLKGPVKTQAFLEAVDDALAERQKARAAAAN